MKYIKIAIAAVAIISFVSSCEKKPTAPFGENVIRYKVNGKLVEIRGKYNGLTKQGLSLSNIPVNYLIGGVPKANYSSIRIGITKPFLLNVNINSDSLNGISCDYFLNQVKYRTNSLNNTCQIVVTNDNSNFIFGTFSGKCYTNWTSEAKNDSLVITDGYFDVSKN